MALSKTQQRLLLTAKARQRQKALPTPQAPESPGFAHMFKAVGEVALTLGSGAIVVPYAGAKALTEEVYRAIHGEYDNLDKMVETIQQTMDSLTYAPVTEGGKILLEDVQMPFEKLEAGKKWLGDKMMELTGSAELATFAYTAPDAAIMGLFGPKRTMTERRRDVRRVQKEADVLEIDLTATKEIQEMQLSKVATELTERTAARGAGMAEVAEAIGNAKAAAKANVDLLYKNARASRPAGVRLSEMNEVLAPMVVKSLEGYDVGSLPIVRARLKELQDIASSQKGFTASIESLEAWRKRINRNKPAVGDLTQQKALGILKAQYDNFMEAQFNADMLSGDKMAITRWKNATKASARYRKTFRDDKVIRQLAEQGATAEEMRTWIFSAAEVGMRPQSAAIVRSIKEIIGDKSRAMESLRQDAMLNIIEPLLLEDPNLKAFSLNYNRLVRKNTSVVKELFSESLLKDMNKFALAIEKHGRTTAGIGDKITTFIARVIFGHSLSLGAARMGVASGVMNAFRKSANGRTRAKIMSEILGYNINTPLIPVSAIPIGGMLQTAYPETSNGE